MIYPEKYNSASRFLFLEHSQEINMTQDQKLKYLSVALRIFGIIFIVGIYAMMMWIWPSGWAWEPRQPEYEQMIMGIYATLGVFLILAARNPMEHLSLIWFTIWSSFVHGGIMLVQAVVDENERANLLGDIPALFLVAIVLWVLVPKKREA
jgi:sterol desaturase/sphingolipid hydroxylase (fatty acid hydroxylase superfamily)